MKYSRTNPSPRYQELQSLYRTLHEKGEPFLEIAPENMFAGSSLIPHLKRIKRLATRTGALTILDYGSGKGKQYGVRQVKDESGRNWDSVVDYWGVDEITCYDPGYPPFSRLPTGPFDGVISTDVLEHCPEEDLRWIIGEIFGFATRFVYANVASYAAEKRLPTGENAHCTIKPLEWWTDLMRDIASQYPAIEWEVWVELLKPTDNGMRIIERRIGSA